MPRVTIKSIAKNRESNTSFQFISPKTKQERYAPVADQSFKTRSVTNSEMDNYYDSSIVEALNPTLQQSNLSIYDRSSFIRIEEPV